MRAVAAAVLLVERFLLPYIIYLVARGNAHTEDC